MKDLNDFVVLLPGKDSYPKENFISKADPGEMINDYKYACKSKIEAMDYLNGIGLNKNTVERIVSEISMGRVPHIRIDNKGVRV